MYTGLDERDILYFLDDSQMAAVNPATSEITSVRAEDEHVVARLMSVNTDDITETLQSSQTLVTYFITKADRVRN